MLRIPSRVPLLLALAAPFTWLAAPPAQAREVIGGDETPEEEPSPEEAPPKKKKAGDAAGKPTDGKAADGKAADGKAAGKKAPAGKSEAEIEREQEAMDEATRKKAEEENRRKKEAEAARKREAELKRSAAKQEVGRANLESARTSRRYSRVKDPYQYVIKVRPGAVVHEKVTTIELQIEEKLAEPDPTYGDFRPVEGVPFTALVTCTSLPAGAGPKGKANPTPMPPPMLYSVHGLEDAGKFGFHVTLPVAGVYEVKVSGPHPTKKDKTVETTFNLHAGVWPPPDFEQEEKNNQTAGAGSGSRVVE